MHQYSRGTIAGLAGAVLAEENCRIWVMQQITWELDPAGPAGPGGKPRARCLYNPNHRLCIDEARFYDEFMIVYHDARAVISRLRDLLRTKVR